MKRQLLFFDQLVAPHLTDWLEATTPSDRASAEWLMEKGLLIEHGISRSLFPRDSTSHEALFAQFAAGLWIVEHSIRRSPTLRKRLGGEFAKLRPYDAMTLAIQRSVAERQEATRGVRATPIVEAWRKLGAEATLVGWEDMVHHILGAQDELERLSGVDDELAKGLWVLSRASIELKDREELSDSDRGSYGADLEDVVEVTLSAFPSPDNTVPLEAIVDFVGEADHLAARQRLQRWARRTATDPRPTAQLEDELMDLQDAYESHMRAARLAYSTGWLQALISLPLEAAGLVPRGETASGLFGLRRAKGHLLASEAAAPGREVAYLVQARAAYP